MAFWIKEYIGYNAIEKVERVFMRRAMQRLLPNPNISILGLNNAHLKRQPILSFLIYSTKICLSSSTAVANKTRARGKPLNGSFVAKLLNDLYGIQARGGCSCAGPYGHSLLNINHQQSLALRSLIKKGYVGVKGGWTRVSFPYYMSEEEFDFILAAMEFIAIYGQRFLHSYHFSWRRGDWTFKKTKQSQACNEKEEANCMKIQDDDDDDDDVGLSYKYNNYLQTAKRIATLLPKYPPQRKIPQGIDVDVLPFRV